MRTDILVSTMSQQTHPEDKMQPSFIAQNVNNFGVITINACVLLLHILSVSQGDSVQTCQGDRTWSGTRPVCIGMLSCDFVPLDANLTSFIHNTKEQDSECSWAACHCARPSFFSLFCAPCVNPQPLPKHQTAPQFDQSSLICLFPSPSASCLCSTVLRTSARGPKCAGPCGRRDGPRRCRLRVRCGSAAGRAADTLLPLQRHLEPAHTHV